MLKPTIRPYLAERKPPVFYDVAWDVNGKIGTLVPAKPVDYPPVDTFDIENLQANGVNPQLVTSPFISSTIEETDATLDQINNLIDENETD